MTDASSELAERIAARLKFLKDVIHALEKLVVKCGRNTYTKVRDPSTHDVWRLDRFGDGFTVEVESGIHSLGNGNRITVWLEGERIFEVKWSLELELSDSQFQVVISPNQENEEKLSYLAQHWEEIAAEHHRQLMEAEADDYREERERQRIVELKRAAQKLGIS